MKRRYLLMNSLVALLILGGAALAYALSRNAPCAAPAPLAADAARMKAVVYRCYGSPEVLRYEDIAKPALEDDRVLVRVRAASVNPLDWHYMRGAPYVMRLSSGLGAPGENRLGVDFAGTVEAVGSKVTRFRPGDAVFGGATGAFGEYVSVRESRGIALKPDGVDFDQVAAVPIAAVTALQALRDKGQLRAGQKVLINGASGGVGTFAVQIAKAYGAQVTGVCSTRNVQMVRELGADRVIDYTREDFTAGSERYDLIVDNVSNHSLSRLRGVLTPTGTLAIVGSISKGNWVGPLGSFFKSMITAPFVDQNLERILADLNQNDLEVLAELMSAGKLRSVIDRRYTLSEVPQAIEYVEAGRARGKVLIDVSGG